MDGIQRLFSGLNAAATGLSAERLRIDVIARNIANAQTTRVPGEDGPYRRQVVSFAPVLERAMGRGQDVVGVRVDSVDGDFGTPFEEVHDPGHPDADEFGVVRMPNVDTMREMADLITAVRSYEANIRVQESFQEMAQRALRLAE